MQVTIEIPDSVHASLVESYGSSLQRPLIEHLALEGYQAGRLSLYEVRLLLGFDNRWDTEHWLGDRGAQRYCDADYLETERRGVEEMTQRLMESR